MTQRNGLLIKSTGIVHQIVALVVCVGDREAINICEGIDSKANTFSLKDDDISIKEYNGSMIG